MSNVPTPINILFIVTTLVTIFMFYKASGRNNVVLMIIGILMFIQAFLGFIGFYQITDTIPPRFILLISPGLLITIWLFNAKKGKAFVDALNIKDLTLLHTIRIPVEITLFYLFVSGLIPEIMTFEGRNFDILSGITAPIIFLIAFSKGQIQKTVLLIWNFVCLALLINIVTIALLSAKTPFQQLAFQQPNIGITYFPFVWLPSIVVPIVLISHLTAIRKLIKK